MRKIKGHLGRIVPKRGTREGRKHSLTLRTQDNGDLLLLIANDQGTWSTDLLLSPAEAADLTKMAITHLANVGASRDQAHLQVVGG